MDAVSYSKAAQQATRISKIIAEPDSTSGLVTMPSVIASGETTTIPAGRVVVHPNLQVDGVLNVEGSLFIPAGGSISDTAVDTDVLTVSTAATLPSATTIGSVSAVELGYLDGVTSNIQTQINGITVPSASETVAGKVELATDAEVQTGTDTVRAVTPAGLLSAFANSKATNGYTKLPNGLILQWGDTGTVAANSTTTVNFPIAFPTEHTVAVASVDYSSTNNNYQAKPRKVSLSQMTILCGDGAADHIYWLAIGY
jgi:hypothetical protein